MSQEMSEHNVQSDSSMEAMKVTFLGDGWTSSTGGLATLNRELAIQLSQHPQAEVCLLVPDGHCTDEDKSEAKKHGITVVSAKKRPGYDEPLDWLGAPPEGHKMDVVVGHGKNLGRQVQFIKDSARFDNCKWVQVVHTAPEDLSKYKGYSNHISKGEKKHEVEVELCKLADLIVPVGPRLEEVYSSCLQRYKRDTCIFPVIPGLFDREFGGLEQSPNENAEFKVLLCGRADEEDFELKGYNLAAKAFTDHRLQGKRYSLLFVGAPEGKQEVVRERFLQYGIAQEQLTVKTFLKSREKIKDLLCEVDLAIMPSRSEGFGLVALEALSAGLPILVNSKSGFARALEELPCSDLFIVNSDEPAKWAKAIEGVRNRHRKRLKEITLLRTSYDKQYSWKEQCGNLVEKLWTMVYGSSNGSVRLPEGELLAQQQSAAVASLEGFCGQQCFSDGEKKGCGANQESESLGAQCEQRSTKQNTSGSTFDLVKKGSGGNEKGELGVQSLQGSRKRKTSGSMFDLDNLRIVRIKTNPEDLNGDQRREFEEFLLYRWQRFKTNNDISSAEGMVEFIEYLTEAHGLFLKEIKKGCLEITVECPTLDSLESLWNDYCCGQLNEVLQKYLVTDEIKEKLNLENVTLQTTIPEEDYIKAKTSFAKMSDIDQFKIPRNVHPAMNSGNNEPLDDLLPRVVKDKLQQRQVKDQCLTFLTKVQIPSGWEDTSYKLDQSLPTYKYRLEILRSFVLKKEAEGFSIKGRNESSKQFFEELKQFSADFRTDYWFKSAQGHRGKVGVDLFEQNVKLQGVVVWKSEKELKASVLIKGEACSKDGRFVGPNQFSPSELVVSLQDEAQPGTEFNLKVAVGDIVEVAKCARKEGEALEPEIIMCCSLSGTEIESYLNILSSYVKDDSSTAAVTEITRCRAAWDYILELSEEEFTTDMSLQILEIINKICSSARMSHTVSEIVQSFQQSKFFRVILPDFINKMTEESCDFSLVQKILERVISVIPSSSGLQVLHMAKALALNLVKVSSDFQTLKDNAVSAVEFLARLSTNIASQLIPGAHKDVEVLSWKELPLIPVTEEIKKPRLKTDDLPVINENGGYKSEEDYLNTYFRLLREECFYKLRKEISDFVINGQKSYSKDMMMYRISLRGACTRHEESPTVVLISLEYELLMETQGSSESENTGWLLYGNLLCISLDGFFQEPVWAVIEKHISEEDQRIIRITLCEKDNTISEPEFITKMQEINNRGEKAFMAESQTFYLSHAPAMEVLQHRDHVPFKEFLVDASTDPGYLQPAEYISQIESPPDWGIIFERNSLPDCRDKDESSVVYSLLKDFDALRLNANYKRILDDSQMNAVELALKNKLALIQGPPGTGKSYVGVALVNLLLSMKVPENHGPILVVTYKNHALDNFLNDCLKTVSSPDLKIVRVGRVDENADYRLKRCLLREVGRQWPERLYKQKRKLTGQIWSLQPRVTEAFERLRSSSNFTADMFIEEARKDQVKCLLTENQTEEIAEAEVDRLINGQWRTRGNLKELVEKALGVWLPSQEDFNSFARSVVKEKGTVAENRDPGKDKKKKSKDDQDQFENPNDFKDPSVEQRERLLAIDEDIVDEEDKEIASKSKSPASRDSSYKSGCLRSLVCIDESKVKDFRNLLDVGNVWELSKREKVRLVYVLQGNFYTKATSDYLAVSKEYAQLHHQLKELKNQHDIEVMKWCHIIGMTVTGATLRANLLADIKPAVMIVEEAAEILEGQLVAVIPPSVQHLIMIGDHKQLRPMVHFTRLKKDCHLDVSMFERLVNCNLPFTQLEYQCRMRDEFVDLLRDLKIYKELKTNYKLVQWNEEPPCVDKTMYFWEHIQWESESKGSHSKRNTREAIEITKVAKKFCKEGNVSPLKITVLCSYRGQVQEIKSHFSSADFEALEDIKVTTIDSFQGQENDIILLSLVRSNKKGTIGYLSSINRLCVAISRARCGLYFFGNQSQLASASKKGWKVVRDSMRKKGCVGTRFPFSSTEHSTSRQHSETWFDRRSLVRDIESTIIGPNITVITATQACVSIGDSSVNYINTSPATVPRSDASLSTRLYLRSPQSGKQPVHDPKSPLPGYRPPTVGGSPTEEVGSPTKEAREPIQEFGKPRKEVGSPTLEVDPTLKEAKHPIQEVGKPK